MSLSVLRAQLERLYLEYNRRELVHPDPLEFLYNYPEIKDREVAGLVASSLAYGRVNQILKSAGFVLEILGDAPAATVMSGNKDEFQKLLKGFRHRFTTGDDIAGLLEGARRGLDRFGSLGSCLNDNFQQSGGDICAALEGFIHTLRVEGGIKSAFVLPSPARKSACKRLFLYLRWMVRCDEVDPGGWDMIPPSALLVPLDTHMHHIATALGFTSRKQADLKASIEITRHFMQVNPDDPVKYDFALTRFGIREELDRLDIPRFVTPL